LKSDKLSEERRSSQQIKFKEERKNQKKLEEKKKREIEKKWKRKSGRGEIKVICFEEKDIKRRE
jgi:hypothetical protein